jgi:hypothetical protein
MVKLIFYGGVNEIGGNKILLEDKGTKIFLDFGQSFTFGSEFFASWLQPRGINGLGDYFEFNLLPKISGLYSKEMLCEPAETLIDSKAFTKRQKNQQKTRYIPKNCALTHKTTRRQASACSRPT